MARIDFKFDINNELTREEMNKAIKRLNQRIFDVARKFGTNSTLYKQYESLIEQLPVDMQRTTTRKSKNEKIEVIQIAKPSTYYKGDEVVKSSISGTLTRVSRKRTATEEVKRIKEAIEGDEELLNEYNAKSVNDLTIEELTDIQGKLSEVGDYINNHKNEYLYNPTKKDKEGVKMLNIMHQKKKSYSELIEVSKYMKGREAKKKTKKQKKNENILKESGIIDD